MGLDDVWSKSRYSEWDRYFVWVFFSSLIGWLVVSSRLGWWEGETPLVLGSGLFSATTGVSLTVVLATEVLKMVTRPAIEWMDEHFARVREERQMRNEEKREEIRGEGRQDMIKAQKVKLKEMLDNKEIDQQTFDLLIDRIVVTQAEPGK